MLSPLPIDGLLEHDRWLRQLALRLARDTSEADELVQETWLVALVASIPAPSTPTPILSTLAMNSTAKTLAIATTLILAVGTASFLWTSDGPVTDGPAERSTGNAPMLAHAASDDSELDEREDEVGRSSAVPSTSVEASAVASSQATIAGRVIDPRGKGIGHVVVQGVDTEETRVNCDANGDFRWPLGESLEQLTVRAEGWTPVLIAWVRPDASDPITIVLAPAIQLSGMVVDETDAPVPGAQVSIFLADTWSRELSVDLAGGNQRSWTVDCDEHGTFRIEHAPAIEEGLLWISRDKRTALYDVPTVHRNDLRLVLRRTRLSADERWAKYPHVRCHVLTSEGEPAAGARVVAGSFNTLSDESGFFRVPLISLASAGSFRVLYSGSLPLIVNHPGTAPGQGADERGGWPESMVLHLSAEHTSSIAGVLIDVRGTALADCTVWLADPTPVNDDPYPEYVEAYVGETRVRTDGDGRFSLGVLPERTYRIAAYHAETLARVESDPIASGHHGVRLVMPDALGKGRIDGRAVDPGGEPLARIEVTPRFTFGLGSNVSEYELASVRTDEEGRFRLESVRLGFDTVVCEGPGIVPQELPVVDPSASELELVVKRRAHLHVRTSGELEEASRFMLHDERGRAVQLYRFEWIAGGTTEGMNVTSWGSLSGGASATYTAAEGSYELRLVDGNEDVLRHRDVDLVAGEVLEVKID